MAERFDREDPRLATAAWSRLAEPGDLVATALVGAMGPVGALQWFADVVDRGAGAGGLDVASAGSLPSRARLARAVERWRPRWATTDPRREIRVLERLGGTLLTPVDPEWPSWLGDLGASAPFALWVRGAGGLAPLLDRSVALVGARACTDYGRHVTDEFAAGLVRESIGVVSGGAYGIDAAAHRAVVLAGGSTVAFLAGGVDRLYPAGNADLLRAVIDRGGALVSEVPPGSVPNRVRFLHRNRLIAAAARATVVVEAAWRSGSLSTATRAGEIARPVGAVPGPVTSPASAGCHRLLREGATCVTSADDVLELVAGLDRSMTAEPAGPQRPADGLAPHDRATWEALPLSSGATVDSVARAAGLAVPMARAALGRLELAGRADRRAGGWCRVR